MIIAATLVSSLAASSVFASDNLQAPAPNQTTGYYIGGNLGFLTAFQTNAVGAAGVGGSVYAGYQFSPYFAVETDLMGASFIFGTNMFIGGIMAKGILPLGDKFSVFAKAGFGGYRVSVFGLNGNKAGLLAGAGVNYAFDKNWAMSLQFNGVYVKDQGDDGESDSGFLGVTGLGVEYHFS